MGVATHAVANKQDLTLFVVVKLTRPGTLKVESENRITEEDDHVERSNRYRGEAHT